ncbi:hypothetical protein [Halosolutus gelatinilyticus]|uniref:hypothetical protein n=1 Tax=Halosolutus gelatinilyticus TaxID=2931975 RepID=UPI001FF13945|nr:hypothetical protein [Halosolutus gelatinilyticus]
MDSTDTDTTPIDGWNAITRTLFALLTVAFAAFVVWMDGQPTTVFVCATVLLLVAFGVELSEIEFDRGVTITFRTDRRSSDRGRTDDDD